MRNRLVRVDVDAHEAWLGDQLLTLTRKEFALLALLVEHAGRVVSVDQLTREAWKSEFRPDANTVRNHVGVLRRKLGDDPRNPSYIFTVVRDGFRLAANATASTTMPTTRAVVIEGKRLNVLRWEQQQPHGETSVWTLYARPEAVPDGT